MVHHAVDVAWGSKVTQGRGHEGLWSLGRLSPLGVGFTPTKKLGRPMRDPWKWKNRLCGWMCGLASAAAPTGPMFSSTPAPGCWLLSRAPSPLVSKDVLHVGQELSCSNYKSCGRDDHGEVCMLSTWNPDRWQASLAASSSALATANLAMISLTWR